MKSHTFNYQIAYQWLYLFNHRYTRGKKSDREKFTKRKNREISEIFFYHLYHAFTSWKTKNCSPSKVFPEFPWILRIKSIYSNRFVRIPYACQFLRYLSKRISNLAEFSLKAHRASGRGCRSACSCARTRDRGRRRGSRSEPARFPGDSRGPE